jgi:capsular polysaccharide biosynthesis protein
LTGGKFSGYYHWLLEDLPVAIASLEIADNPVLIVPEDRNSFVDDVLAILGLPVVELRRPCRIPRLVMTGKVAGIGSPYGVASPHPADVEMLRRFFGRFLKPRNPASRLVVSRAGYRRSAENEGEFVEALIANGFRVVDPARMSFIEQIELFSMVSTFTGIHGAAHANCVWMTPESRVEELLSRTYVSGYFAALSACIGAEYRAHIFESGSWDIEPAVLQSAVASASQAGTP